MLSSCLTLAQGIGSRTDDPYYGRLGASAASFMKAMPRIRSGAGTWWSSPRSTRKTGGLVAVQVAHFSYFSAEDAVELMRLNTVSPSPCHGKTIYDLIVASVPHGGLDPTVVIFSAGIEEHRHHAGMGWGNFHRRGGLTKPTESLEHVLNHCRGDDIEPRASRS